MSSVGHLLIRVLNRKSVSSYCSNETAQVGGIMKEEKIVVGFWWRILADGLDAILLGLFGLLLAIPLQNVFYGMGENG